MATSKLSLRKVDSGKLQELIENRPYVIQILQTQLLYDIAGMIDELKTEFEATVPEGFVMNYELTVVNEYTIEARKPFFSFTLVNDGPDPVYYFVNKRLPAQVETPVNPGEHSDVDFRRGVVWKIILYCRPGETASVRVKALR